MSENRITESPPRDGEASVSEDGAVITVNYNGSLTSFRNRCPHAGLRLDSKPGSLVAVSGAYLVCRMHGAIFDSRTGVCIAGPCNGCRLEPV